MALTPRKIAAGLCLLGGGLVTVGVTLIYTPAGFIAAGVGLLAFGLDETRSRKK